MCDFTAILVGIGLAQAALIGAMVLIGVAIAANSSFWLAPTATVPFGLALLAVFGGTATLGLALDALNNPACGANAACASQYAAAHAAITAMTAGLAGVFALGIVAAGTSGIPIVGAIAMGAYAIGLAAVAIGMGPATQAVAALQHCLSNNSSINAGDVLTVTGYIVSFFGAGFILVAIGSGNNGGGGINPTPGGDGPKPRPHD